MLIGLTLGVRPETAVRVSVRMSHVCACQRGTQYNREMEHMASLVAIGRGAEAPGVSPPYLPNIKKPVAHIHLL